MAPERRIDVEQLADRLAERVANERTEGAYQDDLSDIGLDVPPPSEYPASGVAARFDLGAASPRVRFRPELGFSSKPVIGPGITLVKRFYLRLLFHVFDDLARQTDAALARMESALAVEIASRERLEVEVRELQSRLDRAERERSPG